MASVDPSSIITAITATAASIGSTTVTPHLDTLTAFGQTFGLAAQAKDALNNPISGNFTWVSRTPATATVSATGVVTAVANGSTYVVATEASSTKDSALIVVQQRVASVNVTPNARNIYLTRNFTFTAAAVDGNGHPVAGANVFTWTSTNPAAATVNSSGLVTAVGLGATQIRATSGTIIGVANVNVITPVTRIAVVIDTVGAAKTDTFTMASLGLTRRYRAIGHDTLDAVMSGLAFTWASSNGSVAVMNTTTGDTASVTSAANGVTEIRATAQGFTSAPGAALTVAQQLSSIVLSPPSANPTATVAVSGTLQLTARGKDANGRFISGGSFGFTSAAPAIATIDPATGQVTGVSLGTADMKATSGAITSNTLTVTVGNTGPAIISFGRDTLSVGRGSSASIPILLSKPAGSPVTVNLAVADTFAFWSSASVVIPAGQTSVNATLNGHNAGTTTITATDGSGAGYSPASAVLGVTATMRLTTNSYAILANDIVTTQVLLSDPSPAGGTYVTFGYGTAGIAAISPDPAFIPAGQLAADIQIRGLGAGSTTITPSAIGVNGTPSSFTAYPPVLTSVALFLRLGAGQYDGSNYVYTQTNSNLGIPITATSSDTNVVTVTSSLAIPPGSNYAYYTTAAKAPGTATITFSSPGYTGSNSLTIVSTTPHVNVCCGTSLFTTSPQTTLTIYAEDSALTAHYRVNSLAVRVTSSDSTVMKVIDTLVTIQPGQFYTQAAHVAPVNGGTAWIYVSASGHTTDSTRYSVQGPPLTLSWSFNRLGAGQQDYNLYAYTPNNVTTPLVVTLVNSDSNIVGVPATITIPANQNYQYFNVTGKTPGSVTIQATAAGFQSSSTASYQVTSPRVTIGGGGTLNNFGPAVGTTIYATDSVGNAHYRTTPLAIVLASSDTNVIRVDTVATIAAGSYYTQAAQAAPTGIGSARVVVTAAGHRPDSIAYTVVQPKLNFSWFSYTVGRRQRSYATDLYVYTPNSRSVSVPVTIVQKSAAVETLSTNTPLIAANNNYQYVMVLGLGTGLDTLIASATGYEPDTAFVRVTTPRFTTGGLPGATTTTNPPISTIVYATDSLGSAHYTMDTVVVAATSSDSTVIQPSQRFFNILKDTYYTQPIVNVVGPGSASMTYADSAGTGYLPTTSNVIAVTGPSLNMQMGGGQILGMRQHIGTNNSYVYTPNAVGTPLVINLVSTDPRVATVPATITIPAGQNVAYFDVFAQDTVGTIQIQATATGYNATSKNVQVTVPKFALSVSGSAYTTSGPQTITLYAEDANGNAHPTNEDVSVSLLSSAPGVAGIDSATITIVNGTNYTQAARWLPATVGTTQLQASDARAAQYKYNPASANVAVTDPPLNFSWGTTYLGIGQYIDNQYVYRPNSPNTTLDVTLTHTGTQRIDLLIAGAPVTAVTIPVNTNVVYFRQVGTSAGTDTLVASATNPLHVPATAYTVVGKGTIDANLLPTTIKAGDSTLVTLYARDPQGNARYVVANTTYTLATNANIEFRSGGAVITTIDVPAASNYVQFYVKGVSVGTGTASVTSTNYVSYSGTMTVTP